MASFTMSCNFNYVATLIFIKTIGYLFLGNFYELLIYENNREISFPAGSELVKPDQGRNKGESYTYALRSVIYIYIYIYIYI